MKIRKVLLLILPVFISLALIQFFIGWNVNVELFNRTGFDLDSVSIGNKYVGVIEKNASVEVSGLKELEMQDLLPFGIVDGTIKGKKKNDEMVGLCGTGVKMVSYGNYKFDITLHESEAGYRLFWDYHE